MIDHQLINDLSDRISAMIPDDVKQLGQDLDKNIKTTLQGALSKLDMVSREEFDAQTEVLERTRAKLEALEAKIKTFEDMGK